LSEIGGIHLDVPRDRAGSFEPRIVRKGQTSLDGFKERIIALCAGHDHPRYPGSPARDA
jgi:putative transposase